MSYEGIHVMHLSFSMACMSYFYEPYAELRYEAYVRLLLRMIQEENL
jgi:hypothetical protein